MREDFAECYVFGFILIIAILIILTTLLGITLSEIEYFKNNIDEIKLKKFLINLLK
jgi:hypothetical protein